VSAEETAILRAKLALSPVQVEAMEQEIAELKQEHGVLSGQLSEIRTVLSSEGLNARAARRIQEIVGGV
jgi:hypothetical protein